VTVSWLNHRATAATKPTTAAPTTTTTNNNKQTFQNAQLTD